MTVSNEQHVAEEAVARALRATRANDAAAPARHAEQTKNCPSVARFATVLRFGGRWTPEEQAHLGAGCSFCRKVYGMFVAAIAKPAEDETIRDMAAPAGEETITNMPPAPDPKPK